jgi:hypothetical protein
MNYRTYQNISGHSPEISQLFRSIPPCRLQMKENYVHAGTQKVNQKVTLNDSGIIWKKVIGDTCCNVLVLKCSNGYLHTIPMHTVV